MKNKKLQPILSKSSVIVISFVTAGTLTACSLSFNGHGTTTSNRVIEDIPISSEEVISVIIDDTDFLNDNEINNLTEEIIENASEISDVNDNLGEFIAASLVRVVDGDTIIVEIADNEYSVRLIGIDTPESVASEAYLNKTGKENSLNGEIASDYTKELLSSYDTVYLMQDVSDTDRYGRLLRYVWLEIPEDAYDLNEISTKMVNGILLEQGYATIATYEPDTKYESYFTEIVE